MSPKELSATAGSRRRKPGRPARQIAARSERPTARLGAAPRNRPLFRRPRIDRSAGLQRHGQGRGGFGLDPDYPDLAAKPGGNPTDQSAAADRDKQRVE